MGKTKDVSYVISLENVRDDQIEGFEKFLEAFVGLGHFYNIDFHKKESWE